MARWLYYGVMARFRYRDEVLLALATHGLRPLPSTPPSAAKSFVDGLYRFELRKLRDRLRLREFPRATYARRVDALRRRYAVLSRPVSQWVDADDSREC